VDRSTAARWKEFADPLGIRSQMSIPLSGNGPGHHAFVISRPDPDYGDGDLEFAWILQPLLTGFARQYRSFSHVGRLSGESSSLDLTVREMAVLGLLGQGMTTVTIGRHLAISPRTVQKHLEHIYRKLDVNDRLMAVQRAFGALPPQCLCEELHDGCCFRRPGL
jgi:DNA-binding CsgD family transcriptional regulator